MGKQKCKGFTRKNTPCQNTVDIQIKYCPHHDRLHNRYINWKKCSGRSDAEKKYEFHQYLEYIEKYFEREYSPTRMQKYDSSQCKPIHDTPVVEPGPITDQPPDNNNEQTGPSHKRADEADVEREFQKQCLEYYNIKEDKYSYIISDDFIQKIEKRNKNIIDFDTGVFSIGSIIFILIILQIPSFMYGYRGIHDSQFFSSNIFDFGIIATFISALISIGVTKEADSLNTERQDLIKRYDAAKEEAKNIIRKDLQRSNGNDNKPNT